MEKTKNCSDFGTLYDKYYQTVLSKARRKTKTAEDAEDLCQETFLKAFRFFSSYDKNMPFETWLTAIMTNHSIDSYRRSFENRMNMSLVSLDEPFLYKDGSAFAEISDDTSEPLKILEMKETEEKYEKTLKSMKKIYRDVYDLAEDKSYEEISRILGIKVGTVRSRLHRARMELARENVL